MQAINFLFSLISLCTLLWNGELISVRQELDCDNQITTLDINQCLTLELKAAEQVMETYLEKSKERYGSDRQVVQSIDTAQTAWLTYRQAHCNSVYDKWRGGTIRTSQFLTCSTQLTQQRTFDIWHSFLTYADSTPPLLPDPSNGDASSDEKRLPSLPSQ